MARIHQENMKITDSASGRQKHDAVRSRILLVLSKDGERLLQVDMFGKPTRENPDKVDQSIQFDAEDARKFRSVIDDFLAKVK